MESLMTPIPSHSSRLTMPRHAPEVLLLLLGAVALTPLSVLARDDAGDAPTVRGVLFFSPSCPHCEVVITEHLPGIFERFGGAPTFRAGKALPSTDVAFYLLTNGTLEILFVDVTSQAGTTMFAEDGRRLGIARPGVPRLDIGDDHLTGSAEIPERLPGMIEAGLASGGIAWPAVPAIDEALASIPGPEAGDPSATSVEPAASQDRAPEEAMPATSRSVWDRIATDPLGNGLSMLALAGMLVSLVLVPILVQRGSLARLPTWPVALLAIVGIVVSLYLGIVEASGAEAVCGPIGDCRSVQGSEYATFLGAPVGMIGLAAYALLLLVWLVSRLVVGRLAATATVLAAAIAAVGLLCSVYLTILELSVIGAACMWCLTSALSMLGLFWLTASPGWDALGRLRRMGPSPI
jgi:uncharacterized membrane protein